jgi:hypothetical protein
MVDVTKYALGADSSDSESSESKKIVLERTKQIEESVDFRELWEKRTPIELVPIYKEHIEIFLGAINPAYADEISKTFASIATTDEVPDFYVENKDLKWHWQILDDKKENVGGIKKANPLAFRSIYRSAHEAYRELRLYNIRHAGIFVAINEIAGASRSNEQVTFARAIWVEDDKKRITHRKPTDFPLPPSMIVETSSGKFHYYWLTLTDDLSTWDRIQKEVMVEQYGSDPGANGRNRVMRVPGFFHGKGKSFASRIVFMTDENDYQIHAKPTKEFLELYKDVKYAKKEYGFSAPQVINIRRYSWEEIMSTFGDKLPVYSEEHHKTSDFNPLDAMQKIMTSEDYHGSLHALCMHFANFKQDSEYVALLAKAILCLVPEKERDSRWVARFNDVERSADAAVTKKLRELAVETKVEVEGTISKEKSIASADWYFPFPTKSGIQPLDMLVECLGQSSDEPIKSFNFATALSVFAIVLQNLPKMPAIKSRTATGCHFLLGQSTGGKDLNVSLPLDSLTKALLQYSKMKGIQDLVLADIINGMTPTNQEITSLTAFHNFAASKPHGGIWTNTECSSQIKKMVDENSNTANLTEVVINVQDGQKIPVVVKANTKDAEKREPIAQPIVLLFATQPARVKEYMKPQLLDKGVIGRFDYYVPDHRLMENGKRVRASLSKETLKAIEWPQEIIEFLIWAIQAIVTYKEKQMDDAIVQVYFDEEEIENKSDEDGPKRQRLVDWEIEMKNSHELNIDNMYYAIFVERVQMSVERWGTILAAVEHLWECYKDNKRTPFVKPVVFSDKVVDYVIKLGTYQYHIRRNFIWPLISSSKGLDEKAQALLDAIKDADQNSHKWIRTMSPAHVYQKIFDEEYFIPLHAILPRIPPDLGIDTNEALKKVELLHGLGFIEFVKAKQVKVSLYNKPLKNMIRLTQEGRL